MEGEKKDYREKQIQLLQRIKWQNISGTATPRSTEWEEERTTDSIPAPEPVADYKAYLLVRLKKRAEERARREAKKGQEPPGNLVTWVFRGRLGSDGKNPKDGCYSDCIFPAMQGKYLRKSLREANLHVICSKSSATTSEHPWKPMTGMETGSGRGNWTSTGV